MNKIAISAIISAALLLAPALAAQEDAHVVEVGSLVSRDAVKPGETFQAAVLLKVQAGFHINDNAPLDEFMIPTVLTVADSPDFEVVEIYYPGGRRARFSYSEAELVVYEGEVVLGALLKAKDGARGRPPAHQGRPQLPGLRPRVVPAAEGDRLRDRRPRLDRRRRRRRPPRGLQEAPVQISQEVGLPTARPQ